MGSGVIVPAASQTAARLPICVNLERYRLNLNQLTLPEIKDFNALADRFCFTKKAKRFRRCLHLGDSQIG
jgi:hypothetical protein